MEKFRNGNGTFQEVPTQHPKRAGEKNAILLKAVLDVHGYFVTEFRRFIAFNVMNMYKITDKK